MKESKYNLEINHTEKGHTLYNTRTGMLIRIPDSAYAALKNVQNMPEPQKNPYIHKLMHKGFCVPTKLNESEHFFHQYEHFLKEKPEILTFTIALTTACNYRCFYCFEEGASSISLKADKIESICTFIEKTAKNTPSCHSIKIKWFGGEPLLALSAIEIIGNRIKHFCSEHNLSFETRIITNGSLLTEEVLDLLCQFNLVSVQISLDGTSEEYCRFKGATAEQYLKVLNIIQSQCHRVHFNLRFNATPENYDSIVTLTDTLYADEKIRNNISLYLAPIECSTGRTFTPEEFTDAQLSFLNHLLQIGWHKQVQHAIPSFRTAPCYNMQPGNFTIDPEGNIFACESHLGDPDKKILTVEEDSQKISEKKQTLCCSFNESLNSQCLNCSYFPICFSGCPRKRLDSRSCEEYQRQVKGILHLISQIDD